MAMPERICAYRAHAQHREIHNQRLIKSPPRPDYQQKLFPRAAPLTNNYLWPERWPSNSLTITLIAWLIKLVSTLDKLATASSSSSLPIPTPPSYLRSLPQIDNHFENLSAKAEPNRPLPAMVIGSCCQPKTVHNSRWNKPGGWAWRYGVERICGRVRK